MFSEMVEVDTILGKICLNKKICVFDALSSISIFKLGRLTSEITNYRK